MYRTRAMILNLKRLSALSKVCLRSSNSLGSIKTLSFVKSLSTAIERLDFANRLNNEKCLEYQKNTNSFCNQYQSANQVFQKQTSGHNQDCAFRGNYGDLRKNTDSRGNSGFVEQNPSGIYAENVGNSSQQSRQNSYCTNEGEDVHQNFNGFYGQNKSTSFAMVNGRYGHFSQNTGYNNERGSTTPCTQNPSNSYTGGAVLSPHNHNLYPGGTGNSQHLSENYHGGNDGVNQQTANLYNGRNVTTLNGYLGEKAGNYQENPTGSYPSSAGHNLHALGESQNGTLASPISTDYKCDSESAESSQVIGTIDEFDNFCDEGKLEEAMEVLGLLDQKGISLNVNHYLTFMRLCGEEKALKDAKSVHQHLMRSIPHPDISTYNKILEMYSNCGSMDDAYMVFNNMPQRNLTSWDTMITWLAKHGLGEDAIDLFTQFKSLQLKPDGEMFLGVFSACGVVSDIDEGLLHFESMSKEYGIVPSMKHYVSVVDMLGNAGYLDEAFEFVENMPMEPSIDVWETLMILCRVHGNIELGDRCAEFVGLLDPSHLSEQSKEGLIPVKALDLAREKERKKQNGQNPLEVKSRVHEYRAGDTSHPENDRLYTLLRGMKQQMKEAGYIPETKFVLHDIDQEGKEEALLAHSERLAVAQGLLTSPARFPLRIIKNLRVCGDCHNALKIISNLVGRELIIRDAKRFHHFKDGFCSCRDYW